MASLRQVAARTGREGLNTREPPHARRLFDGLFLALESCSSLICLSRCFDKADLVSCSTGGLQCLWHFCTLLRQASMPIENPLSLLTSLSLLSVCFFAPSWWRSRRIREQAVATKRCANALVAAVSAAFLPMPGAGEVIIATACRAWLLQVSLPVQLCVGLVELLSAWLVIYRYTSFGMWGTECGLAKALLCVYIVPALGTAAVSSCWSADRSNALRARVSDEKAQGEALPSPQHWSHRDRQPTVLSAHPPKRRSWLQHSSPPDPDMESDSLFRWSSYVSSWSNVVGALDAEAFHKPLVYNRSRMVRLQLTVQEYPASTTPRLACANLRAAFCIASTRAVKGGSGLLCAPPVCFFRTSAVHMWAMLSLPEGDQEGEHGDLVLRFQFLPLNRVHATVEVLEPALLSLLLSLQLAAAPSASSAVSSPMSQGAVRIHRYLTPVALSVQQGNEPGSFQDNLLITLSAPSGWHDSPQSIQVFIVQDFRLKYARVVEPQYRDSGVMHVMASGLPRLHMGIADVHIVSGTPSPVAQDFFQASAAGPAGHVRASSAVSDSGSSAGGSTELDSDALYGDESEPTDEGELVEDGAMRAGLVSFQGGLSAGSMAAGPLPGGAAAAWEAGSGSAVASVWEVGSGSAVAAAQLARSGSGVAAAWETGSRSVVASGWEAGSCSAVAAAQESGSRSAVASVWEPGSCSAVAAAQESGSCSAVASVWDAGSGSAAAMGLHAGSGSAVAGSVVAGSVWAVPEALEASGVSQISSGWDPSFCTTSTEASSSAGPLSLAWLSAMRRKQCMADSSDFEGSDGSSDGCSSSCCLESCGAAPFHPPPLLLDSSRQPRQDSEVDAALNPFVFALNASRGEVADTSGGEVAETSRGEVAETSMGDSAGSVGGSEPIRCESLTLELASYGSLPRERPSSESSTLQRVCYESLPLRPMTSEPAPLAPTISWSTILQHNSHESTTHEQTRSESMPLWLTSSESTPFEPTTSESMPLEPATFEPTQFTPTTSELARLEPAASESMPLEPTTSESMLLGHATSWSTVHAPSSFDPMPLGFPSSERVALEPSSFESAEIILDSVLPWGQQGRGASLPSSLQRLGNGAPGGLPGPTSSAARGAAGAGAGQVPRALDPGPVFAESLPLLCLPAAAAAECEDLFQQLALEAVQDLGGAVSWTSILFHMYETLYEEFVVELGYAVTRPGADNLPLLQDLLSDLLDNHMYECAALVVVSCAESSIPLVGPSGLFGSGGVTSAELAHMLDTSAAVRLRAVLPSELLLDAAAASPGVTPDSASQLEARSSETEEANRSDTAKSCGGAGGGKPGVAAESEPAASSLMAARDRGVFRADWALTWRAVALCGGMFPAVLRLWSAMVLAVVWAGCGAWCSVRQGLPVCCAAALQAAAALEGRGRRLLVSRGAGACRALLCRAAGAQDAGAVACARLAMEAGAVARRLLAATSHVVQYAGVVTSHVVQRLHVAGSHVVQHAGVVTSHVVQRLQAAPRWDCCWRQLDPLPLLRCKAAEGDYYIWATGASRVADRAAAYVIGTAFCVAVAAGCAARATPLNAAKFVLLHRGVPVFFIVWLMRFSRRELALAVCELLHGFGAMVTGCARLGAGHVALVLCCAMALLRHRFVSPIALAGLMPWLQQLAFTYHVVLAVACAMEASIGLVTLHHGLRGPTLMVLGFVTVALVAAFGCDCVSRIVFTGQRRFKLMLVLKGKWLRCCEDESSKPSTSVGGVGTLLSG